METKPILQSVPLKDKVILEQPASITTVTPQVTPQSSSQEGSQEDDQSSTQLPARIPRVVLKQKGDKEVLVAKTKTDLFLEEYLRNGGNGTEAAMKVFNVTKRANASSMAQAYLSRAKHMGRAMMEKRGYTYGKMLTLAYKKAEQSKTPEWWDRLMKLGGYEDFMTKQGVTKATVSVMGVQKQVLDEYVEGEYVDEEPEELEA